MTEFIMSTVVLGIGATLFMDLWALIQIHILKIQVLDYALVGRWAGSLAIGTRGQGPISSVPAFPHEAALGWAIHYATGIAYAALFLLIVRNGWQADPTLLPALAFGAVSVVAPFFILQPGLGAGIAASRAPRPNVARFKSFLTHLVFGAGLYLTAVIMLLASTQT